MRILIVGNGGREHALLWKLRRDHPGATIFATMPNAGMQAHCTPVAIAPGDIEALSGWASSNHIDLTVIGPEAPLAMGIVDRFESKGLPAFGPSRAAARIESSKSFAKDLMRGAGVPTADYRTFTDPGGAEAWVHDHGAPIVVKASGLAGGKGAVVCTTVEDAVLTIRSMLGDLTFGEAGREIVIEEFMEGEELSVFALTDGERCLILPPSQDHKRVGEGDTGPNTGGMGAYAPVSIATSELISEAREKVFGPTLREMAALGCPFKGLLYAGLMQTPLGLKVVEFNCRFGDPETQAVLPLMGGSLLEAMMAISSGGSVEESIAPVLPGASVTTVIASQGYPGGYEKGHNIVIPDDLEGDHCMVFHAGTSRDAGRMVTQGGRVLAVTATAPTLAAAAADSREAADRIQFEGAFHRRDIAWRELRRQESA